MPMSRRDLRVEGDFLVSTATHRRTRCGHLELPTLATLRERVAREQANGQPTQVSNLSGGHAVSTAPPSTPGR